MTIDHVLQYHVQEAHHWHFGYCIATDGTYWLPQILTIGGPTTSVASMHTALGINQQFLPHSQLYDAVVYIHLRGYYCNILPRCKSMGIPCIDYEKLRH